MRIKLRFLFIGKIKEKYILEGTEKYKKILRKYGSIEIIEIKQGKDKDVKKVIEKEKNYILNSIKKDYFTILLDVNGKEFSSETLSDFFNKKIETGVNSFQFIIGGAFGVHKEIKEKANLTWKLSRLTFNHHLARLIVLEQVYRVLSIVNKEGYHH